MIRIVADLGNTRLKWARLDDAGLPMNVVTLAAADRGRWREILAAESLDPAFAEWAISSVNPPAEADLRELLREHSFDRVRWFLAGTDVAIANRNRENDKAGADRALAVSAAIELAPEPRTRFVVACGTAITVERIDPMGVWDGGAIAPGLGLLLDSLAHGTALLPRIELDESGHPAACGTTTEECLRAGVFWGAVGAVRELIERQAREVNVAHPGAILWTGGDASTLAGLVSGPNAKIVPHLVLMGVAWQAFGIKPVNHDADRSR